MNAGYIVLGAILIVMGSIQTWLRHGPWARQQRADEQDDTKRGPEVGASGRLRSGRRWEAWTAVQGGVGIVLGIVIVVLGAT